MLWLLPLIALALLSPLLWLLPAQTQSQRMQLRLAARRMGLGMQLVREQWPHWLGAAPNPCAQYLLTRHKAAGAAWCYWQTQGNWVNQWREPCSDAPLLALLTKLPQDAYKIAADKQEIALYWGEQGKLDTLQSIATVLRALDGAGLDECNRPDYP